MTSNELLEGIYSLSERLSWFGVTSDIAGLTFVELWGLYVFLQGVAGSLDGSQ